MALFTSSLAIEALPFLRIFPEISGAAGWLLAGIVGAHFWGAVSHGLRRVEEPLCRRLGVGGDGYAAVVRNWSLALFAAVASLGSALVITTTLTTVFALPTLLNVFTAGAWWGTLMTLVLAGAYVMLHLPTLGVDRLLIGLHAALLLLIGWLGAPSSPVTALLRVPATAYYPLATAGAGLATILIGRRFAAGTGVRKVWLLGYAGGPEAASVADCAWRVGIALTAAALAFTRGVIDFVTVMTLLLAAANFAVLAVSRRRMEFVYTGSGLFVAACLYALLALAAIQGISALPVLATYVAFAALLSAVMLLAAAAWLQQRSQPEMRAAEVHPKPSSRAPAA